MRLFCVGGNANDLRADFLEALEGVGIGDDLGAGGRGGGGKEGLERKEGKRGSERECPNVWWWALRDCLVCVCLGWWVKGGVVVTIFIRT